MFKQFFYLLFINFAKQDIKLSLPLEGIDERPEMDNKPYYESVKNITKNIEKMNILRTLQNENVSISTKLVLIDTFFGKVDNNPCTYDLKKGGLLKDSEFNF